MHRSGTSAVTRLVNLLGAYLGEEESLMRPNEDNPSGYWERQDIYDFHERVLQALSRSWDTTFPLPEGWHTTPSMRPFRGELRRLIETELAGHEIWAWKDPRNCLLFPIWKTVLAELNIDLGAVLVVRNPLEVADSLQKRDGFSREESLGMWLNYNLTMLEVTRGLPRTLVSYDRVLANWQSSLRRCLKEIGLPWPKISTPVRKELENTVHNDLRHNVSKPRDLEREHCPASVIALFKLMNRVAKNGSFQRNFNEKSFRDLLSSHQTSSRLHQDAFRRRHRARLEREKENETQLAELRGQLAIRDTRIEDLERLAENHQARLQEAHALSEQLDSTRQELIAELKLRLEASNQHAAEKVAEIEEVRRELELQYHALLKKEEALRQTEQQLADLEREREIEGQSAQRSLKANLQEKSQRIQVLEALVKEREKVNDAVLSAATRQDQALDALLTQILASRSWRMTEPLRRAMSTLREIRGKLRSERSQASSRGVASESKG